MNIDWSKAPEGATRYHPETSKIIEHWLKLVGDEEWIWTSLGKRWMPHLDTVVDGGYYDRPTPEWSGEGLPPAGTVCEWLDRNCKRWLPVEIMFCSSWVVVVRDTKSHPDGPVDLAIELIGEEPEFRPLRTPEQIAAEEREREIEALATDIMDEQHISGRVMAERLHSLGYRKVEGGAA